MKKVCSILLIAIGIVSIVLSIVVFAKDTGNWERENLYGGDAYTGIQNAAAQTANNVQELSKIAKLGFGSILLIGGAALVVCGLPKKESIPAAVVENNDEQPPAEPLPENE